EVGEDELTGYNFGFPEAEGITEIEVPIGTVVKVMELNTVKVIWENEESYLVALRDITEQKQAMDSIRTLSQRLAEAQEKERRHIGHELHDEVGGALTAIKMMLDRSQKKLGGKAESELHKVNDLVDETMDLVSTLSHNMRPDILDEFGLVEALKWYFERYTERTGIKVCFNQNLHDVKYADNIQTTVYRIIQESLTNAARYAGVDLLTVTIHSNPNVLHVQIEDHGCGFDPLEIAGDSSGITGMQDRATLMGGELFVDSSPGRGTIVICTLPLADV
ncbi:MAG: sensor histidine kinase, partial [Dehalococcoidia bacterium]